ncbi:K+-transporting ATPase ATPase C chain [Gemmobacter aquatilis]|uniref:Potassium-transporting ATPase KdpC subunit n=1 Tax=Gemmobacter aquatilis TaxID=933059 RepID=A0A1H8MN96_9RHOB|nr:potassium-transporting ATPase subunit KdpC [Gemmobacter aquatilis]SEO18807.1 K+-transporting ATPase ATPase C chain [Gemmobacter aquatilis]
MTHLRPAITLLALFTLLLGLAYPLVLTGIASALFPHQSQGSPVVVGDQLIGSSLIGQAFAEPGYFHPRPSAGGYDPMASGGSNLGPTSAKLIERIKAEATPGIPADAVTTSASGLDPDISPENALSQVARVAKARGMPEDTIRALVQAQTESRLWGLIGEPRVHVLALNLALDALTQ